MCPSDCPNAATARALLSDCLNRLSLAARVRERIGDYPSLTILVDGIDVMTGQRGCTADAACRLDVPTAARVLAASHSSPASSRSDGLA